MKFVIVDGPNCVGVVSSKMRHFEEKVKEAINKTGCHESELLYKYTDALLIYEYHLKVVDIGNHETEHVVSNPDKERADLELIRAIASLGKLKFIKDLKFEVTVME